MSTDSLTLNKFKLKVVSAILSRNINYAMEKMILSICELEITSALCSSAFVVLVKCNNLLLGKTILDWLIHLPQQEENLSKHKL